MPVTKVHTVQSIVLMILHLVVLLASLLCGASAHASQRAAIIIGNSGYSEAPLANPVNDAKVMSQELAALKFQVKIYNDLTQQAMYDAIDSFFIEHQQASEVLFFYAGHAIQLNGRNYLIPIDAPFNAEDLLSRLFDLRYLTDKLAALKTARIKVLVLDACRNNPFSKHPQASSGLAEITAPTGTIIAFSTAPGKTAEDGDGANSPYIASLSCAISRPGRKIEDIFKEVRTKVREMTDGKQVPWEATSLEEDFYFVPPVIAKVPDTTPQTKGKIAAKQDSAALCNRLMMKLSLGMEELSRDEQQLLQKKCR